MIEIELKTPHYNKVNPFVDEESLVKNKSETDWHNKKPSYIYTSLMQTLKNLVSQMRIKEFSWHLSAFWDYLKVQ